MIELTRLNGVPMALNSDLIQFIESSPDTTLTLITGEKLVVRESPEQIIECTVLYRARLIGEAARACPGGLMIASSSVWRANAALQASAAQEARKESWEEENGDESRLAARERHEAS